MTSDRLPSSVLDASDTFVRRHVGPDDREVAEMLSTLGLGSLDALVAETVPESIRLRTALALDTAHLGDDDQVRSEHLLLDTLARQAENNEVFRSFIGCGYYDTVTPAVIQRNVLEDPGWYTQYTPYQAEIAQGRLEALLNFQTMVSELTGLPLAGASLLDEATAAAEAMAMCLSIHGHDGPRAFFVDRGCHPQSIAVVRTRAEPLEVTVVEGDASTADFAAIPGLCGVLLQYPSTDGPLVDWRDVIARVHAAGAQAVMAADLLALTLVTPPGELGADIAVGTSQRFGVPMGFGGPHAGYIATKTEHARRLPGRIIGVSRDAHGDTAYRMAIQTREQHIRREKATSNICTAQALLAIMAGMYAVYHGPDGLRRIASRVNGYARAFAEGVKRLGHTVSSEHFFDGVRVSIKGLRGPDVFQAALDRRLNLRDFGDGTLGVFFDETTTRDDLECLFESFNLDHEYASPDFSPDALLAESPESIPSSLKRTTPPLSHPVFQQHRSESLMLRYITKLRGRDLSLTHSMIPLGSCTMKLNATVEMLPVTWPSMAGLHPFAPPQQAAAYDRVFTDLQRWLAAITGFDDVSLQPNAGAQGEYTGLLVIRAYHRSRGQEHRTVCLIPESAHGTNPATAAMVGMQVVVVRCRPDGSVDLEDLEAKATQHGDKLAAVMVTYPSTYGVFDENIRAICEIVHSHGAQVYMDGANLNAQVALTSPGEIGADVCHINLHKTFCIPHGGGGPGMGPIAVRQHLSPFLPGHPVVFPGEDRPQAIGPVSAAPYGSPAILTISWVYMALMGAEGLKRATQVAILNANYLMKRLEGHYNVLFKGARGRCAHEFIIDLRPFEKSTGVKADDVAKRLMDYSFHAPTMSFPVPGTLMIEPTESESKAELDRFADAMIAIREEIRAIESGAMDRADNPLKNAPHTAHAIAGEWKHPYTREQAAYPAPWLKDSKFWPHVGRIDNPYGDRNLVCICPPVSDYAV